MFEFLGGNGRATLRGVARVPRSVVRVVLLCGYVNDTEGGPGMARWKDELRGELGIRRTGALVRMPAAEYAARLHAMRPQGEPDPEVRAAAQRLMAADVARGGPGADWLVEVQAALGQLQLEEWLACGA